MKLLLIVTLLLASCSATPVKRSFPEVPTELQVTCPDLILHEATTKLSEVVVVVTKNYGQYQECQIKVDTWNNWYKSQKEIFDSVK